MLQNYLKSSNLREYIVCSYKKNKKGLTQVLILQKIKLLINYHYNIKSIAIMPIYINICK